MEIFSQINEDMKLTDGWQIFRRYLVMNAFDGILTVLGVIISAFALSIKLPNQVIVSGLGAAIAIGISGSWIAFLTEDAEQQKELTRIESLVLKDLDDTRLSRAMKTSSIINSMVNGLSPFIFGIFSLIPFFFVPLINIDMAYIIAIIINGLLLFILGVFLGQISEQNRLSFGIKTFLAGVMVTILVLLTGN